MVTISHLTKKYVDEMPFVHEALSKKVLNYVAAAEMLMPRIEKEMGKKLKPSSIVMALRRYGDDMTRKHDSGKIIAALAKDTEIGIKSGLFVISVRKSRRLLDVLRSVYSMVDYERGDVLNVIHGNNVITVVFNERHRDRMLELLKNEDVISMAGNLSQVSLVLPEESKNTLGIIYMLTKQLLWSNVNIVETVSAMTELNFIVKKKDALKAYGALEELMENAKESVRNKKR